MWAPEDTIKCSSSFLEKHQKLGHQRNNGGNSGNGLVK